MGHLQLLTSWCLLSIFVCFFAIIRCLRRLRSSVHISYANEYMEVTQRSPWWSGPSYKWKREQLADVTVELSHSKIGSSAQAYELCWRQTDGPEHRIAFLHDKEQLQIAAALIRGQSAGLCKGVQQKSPQQ